MNEDFEAGGNKVHEKTDFEQWVFEFKLEMCQVQSRGEVALYEWMQNSLLNALDPYMDDKHREWLERIRGMVNPKDPTINYRRMQEKELLTTHILDDLGAQFTPRRKGFIKKGVAKLWDLYPPWETTSGTPDQPLDQEEANEI